MLRDNIMNHCGEIYSTRETKHSLQIQKAIRLSTQNIHWGMDMLNVGSKIFPQRWQIKQYYNGSKLKEEQWFYTLDNTNI